MKRLLVRDRTSYSKISSFRLFSIRTGIASALRLYSYLRIELIQGNVHTDFARISLFHECIRYGDNDLKFCSFTLHSYVK